LTIEDLNRISRLIFAMQRITIASLKESQMNTFGDACRSLVKRPVMSLVAILVLALAIGAATTAFSFNDALVFRPFRFPKQDQLVMVWETNPGLPNLNSIRGSKHTLPVADFLDLQKEASSFASVMTFRMAEFAIPNPDGPGWEQGVEISPEFLKTLQVAPLAGRILTDEDFQPGHEQVMLIDDNLANRLYGSPASAVGKTMQLNYSRSPKIVGVMGRDLDFPSAGVRIFLPIGLTDQEKQERRVQNMFVFARLKTGVSMQQAQKEMDSFSGKLEQQHPQTNSGRKMLLAPLISWQLDFWNPIGSFYLAGASILLLLGCATVTGLILARLASSPDNALPATRSQLVGRFFVSGLVLSVLGGVLGVIAARPMVETIHGTLVENIRWFYYGWKYMRVESHALAFAAFVTLAVILLIPLIAFLATRSEPAGGVSPRRGVIHAFAIGQCLAALVLLVAGGVMWKNVMEIVWKYESLEPKNVLSMGVALPGDKYPTQTERITFYQKAMQAIETIPGVTSATVSDNLIGTVRRMIARPFEIVGRSVPDNPSQIPTTDVHAISPNYFETMHMKLISGRIFGPQDTATAPPVVIINETMAHRYWPGEDPVGKRIHLGLPNSNEFGPPATIVGIAPEIRQIWITPVERPAVYLPITHLALPEVWFLVRGDREATAFIPDVRKQVFSLDSERPLYGPRTFYRASVFENLTPPILFSGILLGLGCIGLIMAAIGIYNSTLVSARRFGPQPAATHAFAFSVKLVLLGLAVGLAGTAIFYSRISAALPGVGQFTLPPLVTAILSLLVIGIIAGFFASRSSTSTTPASAARAR
jgi:putative ABC transport system permease protein